MKPGTTSGGGAYEAGENILHLWYANAVVLADEAKVAAFFDEVETRWVRTCPTKPYLLVNYANVHIPPTMTEAYARRVERLRPLVLGTYRYAVGADLTGVSVTLGNMSLALQANIFPDEASARAAIRAARSGS